MSPTTESTNTIKSQERLAKSPQTPPCRREHRLPLKAQTLLNLEKFAPTGSRTQDLRCYRGSGRLLAPLATFGLLVLAKMKKQNRLIRSTLKCDFRSFSHKNLVTYINHLLRSVRQPFQRGFE
jgi:hypothetical protein